MNAHFRIEGNGTSRATRLLDIATDPPSEVKIKALKCEVTPGGLEATVTFPPGYVTLLRPEDAPVDEDDIYDRVELEKILDDYRAAAKKYRSRQEPFPGGRLPKYTLVELLRDFGKVISSIEAAALQQILSQVPVGPACTKELDRTNDALMLLLDLARAINSVGE